LDTYNAVALADIIDGMDLSEEWGVEHLDLRGNNDVEWARQKNSRIRESIPKTQTSFCSRLMKAR
jgi:hypothetical protein